MTGGPAHSDPAVREQHPAREQHGSANLFAGRIAYAGVSDPGLAEGFRSDAEQAARKAAEAMAKVRALAAGKGLTA